MSAATETRVAVLQRLLYRIDEYLHRVFRIELAINDVRFAHNADGSASAVGVYIHAALSKGRSHRCSFTASRHVPAAFTALQSVSEKTRDNMRAFVRPGVERADMVAALQ
jgi:hypothetical protein